MKYIKATLIILLFASFGNIKAQDTTKISLDDFLQKAMSNSGLIKHEQTKVSMARNQLDKAKYMRFVPGLRYESEHSLVPGTTSPNGFPEEQIYLDPDAYNDWEHFGVFTRLRMVGVQPVFTWGAINKAIGAASFAVKAAEEEVKISQNELQIQLYQLYNSYVFALEIERLVNDAVNKIEQVERAITKEDADFDISETELFKFKIFKSEFDIKKAEVYESLEFVKAAWAYALRDEQGIIYEPVDRFLDPLQIQLYEMQYYQRSAAINRPEFKGLDYGREAMLKMISSEKAQNMPGLYFGFTTTFASTPIRPRQPNPFISTPENTFNTALGFAIRQNLNIFQSKNSIEKKQIELKNITTLRDAAEDGITLEVLEAYRKASVDEIKVEKTKEALVTAKEWLAMEQLDYDFGFGRVKDLVDAVKKELELRLKEKESIFDYNNSIVKLNIAAGLPLLNSIEN